MRRAPFDAHGHELALRHVLPAGENTTDIHVSDISAESALQPGAFRRFPSTGQVVCASAVAACQRMCSDQRVRQPRAERSGARVRGAEQRAHSSIRSRRRTRRASRSTASRSRSGRGPCLDRFRWRVPQGGLSCHVGSVRQWRNPGRARTRRLSSRSHLSAPMARTGMRATITTVTAATT